MGSGMGVGDRLLFCDGAQGPAGEGPQSIRSAPSKVSSATTAQALHMCSLCIYISSLNSLSNPAPQK